MGNPPISTSSRPTILHLLSGSSPHSDDKVGTTAANKTNHFDYLLNPPRFLTQAAAWGSSTFWNSQGTVLAQATLTRRQVQPMRIGPGRPHNFAEELKRVETEETQKLEDREQKLTLHREKTAAVTTQYQKESGEAWKVLLVMIEENKPGTKQALELFIERYEGLTIKVDDAHEHIHIPELQQAKRALDGYLQQWKTDAESVSKLQEMATKGDPSAQNQLGQMYENGRGVSPSNVEAVKWYRLSAEQGYGDAQFNLGWMLSEGRGVTQNRAEAAEWYRKAAERGHPIAQNNLGWMYYQGIGVEMSETESIKWYSMAAKKNDPVAQNALGWVYESKSKGKDEYDINYDGMRQAGHWYLKAAKQGYAAAQYNLGRMYFEKKLLPDPLNKVGETYLYSLGSDRDNEAIWKKAEFWLQKAAKQNDSRAMHTLGMLALERISDRTGPLGPSGFGFSAPSIKEPIKWLLKAAEAGNVDAQYTLADWFLDLDPEPREIYFDTNGLRHKEVVEKETGIRFLKAAAAQGKSEAQEMLGFLYHRGIFLNQDSQEAIKWYQKAAAPKSLDTIYNLGELYLKGNGVEKNEAEALQWYQKFAERTNKSLQFVMGELYEQGRSIPKDDQKAANWYKLGAEKGDMYSEYKLAVMYEEGRGVEKSNEKAAKLYRSVVEKGGGPDAPYSLGVMHEEGRGVPKNDEEAVKLFRISAETGYMGYAPAQLYLGWMYYNGRGVGQDYTEAVKWWLKSANQKNAAAQNNLGIMYESGNGVQQSIDEATKWYRLAADQGDGDAIEALKRLTGPQSTEDETEEELEEVPEEVVEDSEELEEDWEDIGEETKEVPE